MPIYEYSCKKCGKTIQAIQKFSDPPLKKHQDCGGALTKLISASAPPQFQGTGWDVTHYDRKGKGSDSEGAKDGSAVKDSSDKKEAAPKSESPSKESSK